MDLGKESLLQRIKEEFPELEWTSANYIGSGFNHAILILDGRIVFRAPRGEYYEQQLSGEIALLDFLAGRMQVRIPQYSYVARDLSFAGYPLVPGQELATEHFFRLPLADREAIAHQLAGFLSALHTTPKQTAKQFNTPDGNPGLTFRDLSARVETYLTPRLTEAELRLIRQFLAELEQLPGPLIQPALIHRDLAWEHILWDAQARQIGIIDFSDRAWGDPALDFSGLMWYGEDFVRHVAELYTGPGDAGLLRRAVLYSKRVPLFLMVDALDGLPCSFEEGYRLFKVRFED